MDTRHQILDIRYWISQIKSEKEKTMKTIITIIFAILIILTASCSQIERDAQNNEINLTGSGNLVSREIGSLDFDQVEGNLNFDLTIRQGTESKVVLTSDDNFIDFIQVEQAGSSISFGFTPGHAYDISGVTLRAEITVPTLSRLDLNSSSHAQFVEYESGQPFEANLTGSSSLGGKLKMETATLNVNGSAYVKLTGSGEFLALNVCGSSIVDLSEFEVNNADLDVSCASKVAVNVSGQLNGEASQNARVTFTGDPPMNWIEVHQYASVQPE
jgi:hypothetical protein